MAEVSITGQIRDILDEYTVELKRATNNSIDVVAKAGVKKLKSNSPKKTGDYARGWAIKRERGKGGINTVTIHNKTEYSLTHLLERGHVVRNAKGVFGRAPAHPHIKPVEEWASSELPAEIERELQ